MNLRKVYLFILLGISLVSWRNNPKPFEIIGRSLQDVTISRNGKVELAEIRFVNTSKADLQLKWVRVENTLPKEWDYSMCAFGKCQIGIPAGGTLKLVSPGKSGFIAIHVFPKGKNGEGKVVFKLIDPKNEANFEILQFQIKAE